MVNCSFKGGGGSKWIYANLRTMFGHDFFSRPPSDRVYRTQFPRGKLADLVHGPHRL